MGSADQLMTGVFQSIRMKELFFQTVSEKTRLQIDEMHASPNRGDASLNSPDPLDSYIPSHGEDEDERVVTQESSSQGEISEANRLKAILKESLGQNLDFVA